MPTPNPFAPPSTARRLTAAIALVAAGVSTLMIVVFVVHRGFDIVVALVGLALAVAGAWWVVTERQTRRILGIVGVVAGLTVIGIALAQAFSAGDAMFMRLLAIALVLAVATACARHALIPDLHALDRIRTGQRPARPVLICNPRSGGGKVERFEIVAAAQELGVETVVLGSDDDLEQLARDAVSRGADCLGMAGGDGSQALVASVAVEHDLPFVCVSAGTRNHFAQDLGLDRDDPRQGLAAFVDGVERRVDHATVNGRLFVNNVSLGVYATIVAEESYRAEKAQTAATVLPDLLGHTSRPFDLQFTSPTGADVDGAFLILVSNNPYAGTATPDVASRHRLDTGTLGVISVSTTTGAEAARLMMRSAIGLRRSSPFWHEFTAETFEVRSRSGHALAGVDGEALDLTTPLRFRSHPRGLRLLVPADNVAVAARRRARDVDVRALVDIAAGRPPRI
ncbi:diacylglycerol kinase family protein [Gordonia sp. CPCC 206044]|uniref:diacylglycerol/lipid kinase family protein n=1 Tax=Gordonia sp. CPCC 206044 TaxID=3140793 RepID=UPI003AF3D93F